MIASRAPILGDGLWEILRGLERWKEIGGRWISWAPFCGGFIARISKGRTLREFVIGVTIVPTLASIVWFSVVGGTAQWVELQQLAPLAEVVKTNVAEGIYVVLGCFAGGKIISWLLFFNLFIFLITSADSASFFVAMQLSKGERDPSNLMKFIWGSVIGGLSLIFLLSGGLQGLQKAAIISGAPFAIVVAFMIVGLFKLLIKEADREAFQR